MTFVGADYSAALKQPNPTWLAVGSFAGGYLQVDHLEKVGSDRLLAALSELKNTKTPMSCGLDFPFGWPLTFLQFVAVEKNLAVEDCTAHLAGQSFATVDALTRDFAKSRPGQPEPKRYTDEITSPKGQSPLHRINPGMLKMTWQGTGLLQELRREGFYVGFGGQSGIELRADSAFEVYPAAILAAFGLPFKKYKGPDLAARQLRAGIIQDLGNAPKLRTVNNVPALPPKDFRGLKFGAGLAQLALKSDDALDSALACLGAMLCFLAPQKVMPAGVLPQPLTTDLADRIELEGWIYSPYLV